MTIKHALQQFKHDNNRYPLNSEGLNALIEKPNGNKLNDWAPMLRKVPYDAWGNDYVYQYLPEKNSFSVYSVGPNKLDDNGSYDDLYLGKTDIDCEVYNDCLSVKHKLSNAALLFSLLMGIYLIGVCCYRGIQYLVNK